MDSGGTAFNDFASRVNMGQVPGVTRVAGIGTRTVTPVIAATTAVQGIVSPQDVWVGAAAAYPWMTTDTALEALSDNANDTAAGTGAQNISLSGLSSTYVVTAATNIPLNGITPVALGSHFRINSANTGAITPAAAGNTNIGTITIRDAGGGTVRAVIPPGERSAQQAVYTVPDGFFLDLFSVEVALLRSAGGTARGADFGLYFKFPNGAYGTPRQIQCTDTQPYALNAQTRIPVGARTDFMIRCVYSSVNNIVVGAAFEGHLYKI